MLANFFMGHYEKLWLNNYTGPKVLYYRRYVDDIICCFRNSNDARLFFEYLNSCHPNIKFTMETEERDQLPFLDVLLSKQSVSDRQGSFITSVYRKKTFTGLLAYTKTWTGRWTTGRWTMDDGRWTVDYGPFYGHAVNLFVTSRIKHTPCTRHFLLCIFYVYNCVTQSFCLFLILVTSAVWISVPSIFCNLWQTLGGHRSA